MAIVPALLVILMVNLALARPDEENQFYDQVFEEVDVDLILDNEIIVRAYLNCIYGKAHCDAHQDAVKESIPEILSTVCGKCNDKQKEIFKYSLNKFIPKHQADWEQILSIYDPKGEYWPKIKAFMES